MRLFFCFVILIHLEGLAFAQNSASPTISATQTEIIILNGIERIQWESQHPPISSKYFRGNFLIYDCIDKHYACVEEQNFLACKEKRQSLISKGVEKLPCAPFKEYPTYILCIKKQYELMYSKAPYSFCLKTKLN